MTTTTIVRPMWDYPAEATYARALVRLPIDPRLIHVAASMWDSPSDVMDAMQGRGNVEYLRGQVELIREATRYDGGELDSEWVAAEIVGRVLACLGVDGDAIDPPRWRVTKDATAPAPYQWVALRDPMPEDDPRVPFPAFDDRTSLDGSEHATMQEAYTAALQGVIIDAASCSGTCCK
jgi:hypothetical protein